MHKSLIRELQVLQNGAATVIRIKVHDAFDTFYHLTCANLALPYFGGSVTEQKKNHFHFFNTRSLRINQTKNRVERVRVRVRELIQVNGQKLIWYLSFEKCLYKKLSIYSKKKCKRRDRKVRHDCRTEFHFRQSSSSSSEYTCVIHIVYIYQLNRM